MFAPHSIQLTSRGRPVRLHLVSTGMGADRPFTEWLPVWVMIIEHPDGIFLIDTGECADAAQPGYFSPAGWLTSRYMTYQYKFSIRREDEIDRQLTTLGISPPDIHSIILTHLHFDHTDGLKHFPFTPICVNRLEWEHPFGALPQLFPFWLKPTLLTMDRSCGPFQHAHFLAEDLVLVHTPGHTIGHCSVLLLGDDCHILFAGDVCYNQQQLLEDKYSARPASRKKMRQTYAAIKTYAREHPLVFLPSHDPDSGLRLQHLEPLTPTSTF